MQIRSIIICISLSHLGFGKIYNGAGLQATSDGTGIYYKPIFSLTKNTQLIANGGVHFDNSQQRISIFGNESRYQCMLLDFSGGYRKELLMEGIAGLFRPVLTIQTGGLAKVKSFNLNNITGIWKISYTIGAGIQFYNNRLQNEIMLKYTHSAAFEEKMALQFAFYWR